MGLVRSLFYFPHPLERWICFCVREEADVNCTAKSDIRYVSRFPRLCLGVKVEDRNGRVLFVCLLTGVKQLIVVLLAVEALNASLLQSTRMLALP